MKTFFLHHRTISFCQNSQYSEKFNFYSPFYPLKLRNVLAEFEESLGTESWQQCRENLKVLTETFLVMTRQFKKNVLTFFAEQLFVFHFIYIVCPIKINLLNNLLHILDNIFELTLFPTRLSIHSAYLNQKTYFLSLKPVLPSSVQDKKNACKCM